MIHPFMPFLTEELWQRLPRRQDDKTPSITVASFPQYTESFNDEAADAEYELIVDVSGALRSLTAEYGFKDNGKTYIQPLNDATHKSLQAPTSLPSMRSLAGKTVSEITILSPSDSLPTGCAYLDVKGRIEVDKEITKAQDRLKKANETVEKQKKIMDADWEEKVSDVVKEQEKEKLRAAEIEGSNWQASIEQFEKLKLSE